MKFDLTRHNNYGIVIRPGAGVVERFAAEELASYLRRASASIPAIGECGVGSPSIRLELSEDPEIRFDGFRLSERGTDLVLSAREPRGLLNGVYTLLFRNGFRWCWLGKDGEIVPRLSEVDAACGVTNPDLEFRGVCIFSVTPENVPELRNILDFLAKNRFNLLMTSVMRTMKRPGGWRVEWQNVAAELLPELEKRGTVLNLSEHSGRWFFPKTLFAEHPEWFAMASDGRRFDGGQLCYSNPAAVDYLTCAYVRYAEAHPEVDILGTWPEDGYGFCQCPDCREPGAVLKAVNHIADALARVRPDLTVEYLSYTRETSEVPEDLLPRPNMIALVANMRVADEWKRKSDLVGARGVYALNYCITDNTAGRADLQLRIGETQNECRAAVKANLRGIIPFYIGTDTWWRSTFNLYFFSRFAWERDLDASEALSALCRSYFPHAEHEAHALFVALTELPRVRQDAPPPWKLWQDWPTLEADYDGPDYAAVQARFAETRRLVAAVDAREEALPAKRHLRSAEKFIEFREKMFASWHCRALAVRAFRRGDAEEVRRRIAETGRLEAQLMDEVRSPDRLRYGVSGAWIDYEFFANWRLQLDQQLCEMRTEANKKPFMDMNPDVELFLPGILNA